MTAASRSSTSPDLMLGRTVGTHYVVQQLLGRGRRSTTYLAEHRTLHRRVVVKLLDVPWAGDPEAVARFEAAARSLSTMEAPNVAAVIDFGREGGRGVFVVNELAEGETLDKFLVREGPLPVELFVPIASQILKGIGAAHTRGLFHLDLKPANVMICSDGDRGQVKILDLGLVQLFEGHVSGVEAPVVGDPAYQAPEQITQRPLDSRTDTYALGCLFYRMLSGKTPFSGNDAQILYSQVHDEPKRLAAVMPAGASVSEDLAELILDCIHKDADARPVDANEIVERLIDAVPAALFRLPVPAPLGAEPEEEEAAPVIMPVSSRPPPPRPAPPVRAVTLPVEADPADESSSMRRVAPVIGALAISEPVAGRSGWNLQAEESPAPAAAKSEKSGGGGWVVVLLLMALGGLAALYFLRPDLLGLAAQPQPTRPPVSAPAAAPVVAAADSELARLMSAAQTSEAAGDRSGAEAGYRKVLAIDPSHAGAQQALAALTAQTAPSESAGAAAVVDASAGAASVGAEASAGEASAGANEPAGESAGEASAGEASAGANEPAGESAGEASAGANEPAGESAGEAPAPAGVTAWVEFKVAQAGTVMLDGKSVGSAPGKVALPLGKQAVRIEAKGFMPWEKTITVVEGMAPVKVTMKRRRAPGDPVNFEFNEDDGVPTSLQIKK
jgi:serine/threonine protein kinase